MEFLIIELSCQTHSLTSSYFPPEFMEKSAEFAPVFHLNVLHSQVNAGLECGIGVDDFLDWEVGDVIEAFNTAKKQRTLEEASASVAAALAGAGVER